MRNDTPPVPPAPTGPYPVGRRLYDLTDPARCEPYARRSCLRRLPIWYPAVSGTGRPAPYLPGAWRVLSTVWGLGASALRATGTPRRRTGLPHMVPAGVLLAVGQPRTVLHRAQTTETRAPHDHHPTSEPPVVLIHGRPS